MLSIRPATIEDTPLLSAMIRELAEFERELNLVVTTEADQTRSDFVMVQTHRSDSIEQVLSPFIV